MPDVWQQVLNSIEEKINQESFDTWFSPTSLLLHDGKHLEVAVPNQLFSNWLTDHYSGLIRETLQSIIPQQQPQVKFVVVPQKQESHWSTSNRQGPRPKSRSGYSYEPPQLNPRYTFSNFIIGASNQFAHAASLAVADQPSRTYNPFFIYGGVGLGKTHLLHAIGHRVLERTPTAKVVYVCAEEFMNELVNAIRFDRTSSFRDKYRCMDVLLIDDIQFIAGKERTQEEFFHTFNALHEAHKQIVLTSDSPPKEIPTIEERLRSRFEWGLIADIQPPDLETKIAIIKKKAEKEGFELPDSICLLIASSSISNIRELEGSLNRIAAYSTIHGEEITLNLAQRVLKDILQEKEKSVTLQHIQEVVANYFGIKVADLKSRARTSAVSLPRQIAMYLCRTLTSHSFPQIGKSFGGKDHTTVLHACNKVAKRMESDNRLKNQVNYLIDSLKSG